jgi:sulfoxide reductase catalytic subunit YedY
MVLIRRPRGWEIPERQVTPEEPDDRSRREFLRAVALGGAAAAALFGGCSLPQDPPEGGSRLDPNPPGGKDLYPARRNPAFADPGRELTPEGVAAITTKFFEFSLDKTRVWRRVEKFQSRPWTLQVAGLCQNPMTLDLDELGRLFPLEERIYRQRGIEGWGKTVPWTGFPLRLLLQKAEPSAQARFVRFSSFMNPEVALQQRNPDFPWPYTEGLTLAEAMNELTLLVTGMYGHGLPKQHGAPFRLVVPWKWALKSIKSLVRIELTDEFPNSFWNTISPKEVDWVANVDPDRPHPRWNQTDEWLLGLRRKAPTLLYNGYGQWAAELYRT